jgi:ribose transport system ATP-binding protein
LNKARLVSLMLGRELEPDYRAEHLARPVDDVVFEGRGIGGRYLKGVDLVLRRGEVLGIAGLPGSGREEIAYAVAGVLGTGVTGEVRVPTRSSAWIELERASNLGVVMVPADRSTEGIIVDMTIAENLSLSALGRFGGWGRLSGREEKAGVSEWLARLSVVCSNPTESVTTLSGGNQQKVLIGRALMCNPPLLVLCEPTAGVDIGARRAIFDFIVQQASEGLTVVVSSSDVGDLVAMCTRVIVIREGEVVAEFGGNKITEPAVVNAMEGISEAVA